MTLKDFVNNRAYCKCEMLLQWEINLTQSPHTLNGVQVCCCTDYHRMDRFRIKLRCWITVCWINSKHAVWNERKKGYVKTVQNFSVIQELYYLYPVCSLLVSPAVSVYDIVTKPQIEGKLGRLALLREKDIFY